MSKFEPIPKSKHVKLVDSGTICFLWKGYQFSGLVEKEGSTVTRTTVVSLMLFLKTVNSPQL